MAYDDQRDMYSRYNDHYDPSMRYEDDYYDDYQSQVPTRLKPYHMKGRILTYLSFPIGFATVAMVLVAFMAPVEADFSANIIFLGIATGFIALLFGLLGKIRGRKELDLPRWPSSFGMLFGFLGLMISSMVVYASWQTYANYGEMLAEEEAAKKAEEETVSSIMTEDGQLREPTERERREMEQDSKRVAKEQDASSDSQAPATTQPSQVEQVSQGSAVPKATR